MNNGAAFKAYLLPLLKNKGLNQLALTDLLNMSKSAATGWFKTGRIDKQTLRRISKILDEPLENLLAVLGGEMDAEPTTLFLFIEERLSALGLDPQWLANQPNITTSNITRWRTEGTLTRIDKVLLPHLLKCSLAELEAAAGPAGQLQDVNTHVSLSMSRGKRDAPKPIGNSSHHLSLVKTFERLAATFDEQQAGILVQLMLRFENENDAVRIAYNTGVAIGAFKNPDGPIESVP